MKKGKTWYESLFRLLRLETTTPSGRINLTGVVVLVVFCLLYTAQDTLNHLISSISDTIKSVTLGTDIYHPYESTDVIKIFLPILTSFGICLLFLYINDKKVQEIENRENDENEDIENPIEKI